jgi:hypothetical protein
LPGQLFKSQREYIVLTCSRSCFPFVHE